MQRFFNLTDTVYDVMRPEIIKCTGVKHQCTQKRICYGNAECGDFHVDRVKGFPEVCLYLFDSMSH